MQSDEKELCLQDIHECLKQNDTWILLTHSKNVQIVQNRWVLCQKTAGNWSTPFKAWSVAKDYVQKPGIDYEETFFTVARYVTIRNLLAVAATDNMNLKHFAVKTAFLNGTLEEYVHLEQSDFF